MKEEMNEPEEQINETEDKTETENKNSLEELPALGRFTKSQVQEVYDLLEQEKSLEEISKFFEEKYKCRPLEKQRLQKHALKFHKLKRGSESNDGDGDNKIHDLEPPSSEITNQDIEEMKEKMLSAPAGDTVGGDSVKKEKIVSNNNLFFGIDMKFLIIAAVVVVIVIIFFLRRKEQKIEPEPVPEPPQQKPQPQIKWV